MAEGSDRRQQVAAIHSQFRACTDRINACAIAECMFWKGEIKAFEKARVRACDTAEDAVSTLLDIVCCKGRDRVAVYTEVLESLVIEHRSLAKRFGHAAVADATCESMLNSLEPPEDLPMPDRSADATTDTLVHKLAGTVLMDRPGIRWDDVVGLEAAKQALKAALLMPLQFRHLFESTRSAWHGILLFGPPGAGKTFLAKAVAEEVQNYQFLSVSSSDLLSKWQEDHGLMKSLLELAKAKQPCVVFIDDIDLILGSREGDLACVRSVRSTLLRQMDGRDGGANVMVLGATNMPWTLDSAVRKKFEKKIYVPLPDEGARTKLIRRLVGMSADALTDADLATLSKDTKGYSVSDIICLVRSALMAPVREICKATHFRCVEVPSKSGSDAPLEDKLTPCSADTPGAVQMSWTEAKPDQILERSLTRDDLLEALGNTKPSIDDSDILKQEEFARQCSDGLPKAIETA